MYPLNKPVHFFQKERGQDFIRKIKKPMITRDVFSLYPPRENGGHVVI